MASIPPTMPVTMAGRLALPMIAALRASGRDVAAFLAALGLDEATLADLNGRLTMEAFMDLHAACITETGDPAFPLHAVQTLDRQAFPLGFYILGSQTTIRQAYEFARPYWATILDRIDFTMTERGPICTVDFVLDGRPLGPPAFAEYYIAMLLAFGRMLIADAPPPTEVVFPHKWPRHVPSPEAFFGAPVRFGGEAVQLVFPKHRFESPIDGADPQLGRLLAQSAEGWLSARAPADRVRNRVHRLLATKMMDGVSPAAREVGRSLRMSERTLRRRLQAEGTSMRELLDSVRHEVALALLERGHTTLDEIAYRLGFSGANAFRRAFKRWTGKPPAMFRRGADRGA